jgi:malonate transporter
VFTLTVAVRARSRGLSDAAIDALNAGYSNVGFIGFPLGLAAMGHAALIPTMITVLLTICGLFAITIVVVEIGLGGGQGGAALARKVGVSLLKNPLVTAPVLGALVPITGASVPVPVESFLKLLGGAAAPCALAALGMFLAQKRPAGVKVAGATALLTAFKLILQPALTWVLAVFVFRLPPLLTHVAVLQAALPTGTGPFMLAELYRREAAATSSVILVSTVLSVITLSAYLAWGL